MKKILLLTFSGIILIGHAQEEVIVSIKNQTVFPLTAQLKNKNSASETIQPNTTGFIKINQEDQREVILSQKYMTDLGISVRKGFIPTVSAINSSFMVVIDQANNLFVMPAQILGKQTAYGPGIRGRL